MVDTVKGRVAPALVLLQEAMRLLCTAVPLPACVCRTSSDAVEVEILEEIF
jgi:hypothetical protein